MAIEPIADYDLFGGLPWRILLAAIGYVLLIGSLVTIMASTIVIGRRRPELQSCRAWGQIAFALLIATAAHAVEAFYLGHRPSIVELGFLIVGSLVATAASVSFYRLTLPELLQLPRREDVTIRELAKIQAKAEASHLRMVVQHVADGIATISADLRITGWNQAAERIFGLPSTEVIGLPIDQVISGWQGPTITPREAVGRRRDGRQFPMDLAVGQFVSDGQRHFTAVFRDITERKQADENLRLARNAAEEASQAKSRFLANMSHEIRTPLGALLGFSELLVTSKEDEDRAACISAIRRNGDLLSNVINDILDLSKVEADKLEIEKQTVPLVEVISDISSLLGLQAQEKGIMLSVRYEGQVPRWISTDPLRLRQILVNIVGNAIKFTNRGEVQVTIRMCADGPSQQVVFDVADTGPGISEDLALRIFNPFAQGDSSRTRSSGGAGLGLVLAKRLAQLLGGDVRLTRTQADKGSVFTVIVDPGEPAATAAIESTRAAAADGENPRRLDGVRILLVEDSPDNQMLIKRFLTMAGASVAVASNGREGVEIATSQMFDLVVMDIQMPVMDGYEAITQLRGGGYDRPVIALTAHALKDEQRRCFASGFNGHLSKPINRRFLVEQLCGYLQFQNASSPAPNSGIPPVAEQPESNAANLQLVH